MRRTFFPARALTLILCAQERDLARKGDLPFDRRRICRDPHVYEQ